MPRIATVPTLRIQNGPCMSSQGEFSTMPLSSPRPGRRASAHSDASRPPVEWAAIRTSSWPSRRDDPLPGGVEVLEVLRDVGDVRRGLVLAQRAAVLAQVDGVEVVAAVGPPLGELLLEEVVAEPVHVEHRAAASASRAAGAPGCTRPRPPSSGARTMVSTVYGAPRTSVSGSRVTARLCHPTPGQRWAPAAATRASKSRWSRDISGCHCTARQNRSPAADRGRRGGVALHRLDRAVLGPGGRDVARVRADRLVVVAVRARPGRRARGRRGSRARCAPRPCRRRRRPGCAARDRPRRGCAGRATRRRATAISCMPRQTPSVGRPTLRGGGEQGQLPGVPVRSPGRGALVRLLAVARRVDVGPAGDHQRVERAHDGARRVEVGRGRGQQHGYAAGPDHGVGVLHVEQVGALAPHAPGRVLAVGGDADERRRRWLTAA